jgi:hypothetical protein
VAQEALRVLDIPKDLPEVAPDESAPEPEAEEPPDLAIAELGAPPAPEEDEQTPEAAAADTGPRVPDFQGMTMRAVLAQASELGLPVLVDGSGLARGQYPPPGSVLSAGERVRVRFAR